jgi:hypothetical protein
VAVLPLLGYDCGQVLGVVTVSRIRVDADVFETCSL